MRYLWVASAAAMLAGCGAAPDDTGNQAAAKAAPAKKPAHCFFKEDATKGWAATRGADGNIHVTGKAYRQDSRYKAVLGPPQLTGTIAEIAPTITINDTGYAAPDDWWDVSATIPDSGGIDTVVVRCGATTLAEIKLRPKG